MQLPNTNSLPRAESLPSEDGYFGEYGGRYIPETLYAPIQELTKAFNTAKGCPRFNAELNATLNDFCGRPTPLYAADKLSGVLGGARIVLKREDLLHTGAHKINNCVGQAILAKRMGKTRVIAETGAGQHGTATAAAAARLGLKCTVYMGAEDMRRQALNVTRMRLMGAEVIGVSAGQRTLKEAVNEAMRDWVASVETTHYILGTVYGPHPFPQMVRHFHKIIGEEAKAQMLQRYGKLPAEAAACIGGGSNAMGLFFNFLDEPSVQLTGVEAGGRSAQAGEHAARLMPRALENGSANVGVLQGCKTYILQNEDGQIGSTHSISAGLDYAALGPEHAHYHDAGRIHYAHATDAEALDAFEKICLHEGILPALESSHALAYALKRAPQMGRDDVLLVNLSGRGDKDVEEVTRLLKLKGA